MLVKIEELTIFSITAIWSIFALMAKGAMEKEGSQDPKRKFLRFWVCEEHDF